MNSHRKVRGAEAEPRPELTNLGSLFVEPPWTVGKGRLSASFNYYYLDFEKFDGHDLNDAFDEMHLGLSLDNQFDLKAHVGLLGFTYGITDRLDAALIVPMIALKGSGDGHLGALEFADFDETTS